MLDLIETFLWIALLVCYTAPKTARTAESVSQGNSSKIAVDAAFSELKH